VDAGREEAGRLDLLGPDRQQQLSPGPVGAGVADEEVRRPPIRPPQPKSLTPGSGLPQRAKR
jgi:hypothetical protein